MSPRHCFNRAAGRVGALTTLGVSLCLLGWPAASHAEEVTFVFSGESLCVFDCGSDLAAGDPFVGSYSIDTAALDVGHPDETLESQFSGAVTAWSLSFPSRGYLFQGIDGTISAGNDTAFGDRYIATLFVDDLLSDVLPSGSELSFFQLDFQDPLAAGADFLMDNSIQSEGFDLTLIDTPSARFLLDDNRQPRFQVQQFTLVPEPAGITLLIAGLAGVWRRSRQFSSSVRVPNCDCP